MRNTLLPIGGKVQPQSKPFDSLVDSHRWARAKLLQNGAKFIQKLTPGFQNYMTNLDNLKQAVENPKGPKSMCYICPKNAFLQLKLYIQRIYLTLVSTNCVKIYQNHFP